MYKLITGVKARFDASEANRPLIPSGASGSHGRPLAEVFGVVKARGRSQHTPGRMNKAEEMYAADLEIRRRAGEVAWWAFEPIKLRLADRTYYTPDFMVMLSYGLIEFHEVKGHAEDDAMVKIKAAAAQFWMFRFLLNGRELPT
jgi:hypothetical protein